MTKMFFAPFRYLNILSCVFLLASSFFLVCPMFSDFRDSSLLLILIFFHQSSFWASSKKSFCFWKKSKIIDSFLNIILFEKPFFLIFTTFRSKTVTHAWSSKNMFAICPSFQTLFWKTSSLSPCFCSKKKKPPKSNRFSYFFSLLLLLLLVSFSLCVSSRYVYSPRCHFVFSKKNFRGKILKNGFSNFHIFSILLWRAEQ